MIEEQFVEVLFKKSNIENVSQMFKADFKFNGFSDRMPIEFFDVSFRLFKPTENLVNLEFLASSRLGYYFQPIGLYDNKGHIFILNEYVSHYNKLRSNLNFEGTAIDLMMKVNALIAAFSVTTFSKAIDVLEDFDRSGWQPIFKDGMMISPSFRYDKYFECNGLKCELLFCEDGYPQFFLDDEYNIEGPIAAYKKNNEGKVTLHAILEYQALFDSLNKSKLLTAFNLL